MWFPHHLGKRHHNAQVKLVVPTKPHDSISFGNYCTSFIFEEVENIRSPICVFCNFNILFF